MKKLPFNKNNKETASKPVQLIHSNVGGPITPASHEGYSYWITFIDDHTCYPWILFLKNKSEAFTMFKQWKAEVKAWMGHCIENFLLSDNWIKFLHTDSGGKYMLTKFREYLWQHGIVHETTAAKTPESNGLAECMNQTIVYQGVSMLIDSGLPKSFWVEVFHTVTYLVARSPATGLKGKTPYKALTVQRVDPTFFRPFGCIAYALVCKLLHKKLDSKAHKCVMLGYEYRKKAYRLFNLTT